MPRYGSWMLISPDKSRTMEGFDSEGDANLFKDNTEGMEDWTAVEFKDPWPNNPAPDSFTHTPEKVERAKNFSLCLVDENGHLVKYHTTGGYVVLYDHDRKHTGVLMPIEDGRRLKSLRPEDVADLLGKAIVTQAEDLKAAERHVTRLENRILEE